MSEIFQIALVCLSAFSACRKGTFIFNVPSTDGAGIVAAAF